MYRQMIFFTKDKMWWKNENLNSIENWELKIAYPTDATIRRIERAIVKAI